MKKSSIAIIILSSCLWSAQPSSGLDNALDISRAGVIAQQTKLDVIAQNIANIDTTQTDSGYPYRRKVAILRPVEYFSKGSRKSLLRGVEVRSIEEDQSSFRKVFDPTHPDADKDGYVYYPNVDLTKEIVEMSRANSSFEANVVVFNTTKQMMQTSLEIGR